jgi:Tol biopolymer transport system component
VRRALLGSLIVAALAMTGTAPGASAAVPALNGKILFNSGGDIWTVNPDGSGPSNLTTSPDNETCDSFSPDGGRITFSRPSSGIWVMNADGSNKRELDVTPAGYDISNCPEDWFPDGTKVTFIHDDHCDVGGVWNVKVDGSGFQQIACGPPACEWDTTPENPDWSPDGTRLALVGCSLTLVSDVWVYGPSGQTRLTNTPNFEERSPDFSPDGSALLYSGEGGINKVNVDGTGHAVLSSGFGAVWSPEGDKIVFSKDSNLWTMNPDGSQQVNVTNDSAFETSPFWSPDAAKIAFSSNRDGDYDVYVMNRDGTGVTQVTNMAGNDIVAGWQKISTYPRPKGATPVLVALTIAYEPCTAPDREHNPPLSAPSCSQHQMTSDYLTVGTGDANSMLPRSEGNVRVDAVLDKPATPADESDVRASLSISDVFTKALADYAGELRPSLQIQATDKDSTPSPGAATTQEFPLGFSAPCTPTADAEVGSVCSGSTTANAIMPGLVKRGLRTIWQLGQVKVYDGGADSDGDTTSDNTLFADEGIFAP